MDPSLEARLDAYAELIKHWAPKVDLVSPRDLSQLRERHIEDAFRLLPLFDSLPPGPCVDVGSGVGIPGIPLAVVGNRRWLLLEPRHRRAAFLEEVVRRLELDCVVLPLRAQEAATDPALRGAHALAAARALAPPSEAMRLLRPLIAPGGVAAVFLGAEQDPPPGSEVTSERLAIVRFEATATLEEPTDN